MPSSSDPRHPATPLTAAALVEKIEELSLLRTLNDRLAGARDFGGACRALVDLVWEERRADAVAYVTVDGARRVCRLEGVAPARAAGETRVEFAFDESPFPALLDATEPLILDAPEWLINGDTLPGDTLPGGGVLVSAPTCVRGTTTGILMAYYCRGSVASLEEDARVLAIVAASAALALDGARSQVREEFLAALRHDINNPLHAALGHTEMIIDRLRAAGDEETLARAGSVVESLKVAADLVSNYLHMAVIDRGGASLEHELFDLGALAGEIVTRFRPVAAEKRLAITCAGGPAPVRGDRLQLGRVITNLLSNAVKYTPGPGRITVATGTDAEGVTLAVSDTGYGLSVDDLRTVGTKYTRFHRDKAIPGTGLGLYILRAIVDAHGGTLVVASAQGEGSTFTVRLPRPV